MKIIRYTTIMIALFASLWACDDEYEPKIPQGRVEEVAFERDTFIFSEGAGTVEVPIIAAKYVNYATEVKVKVVNHTACADSNFIVEETEVKIPLGESQIGVQVKIIDDTIINESRDFSLVIESISGGGKAAAERQSCVVVIRNNDYEPEATLVFDRLADTVREDGRGLIIPFHMTMAAPGDVTVEFAAGKDGRPTANEGEHFQFKNNVKKVVLPEGTLKGNIELDIINNGTPDGEVFFNLVIHKVEGALIGVDSVCKVVIVDDDLDRTLRFGKPEGDTIYHEEAGIIEIPLIFEGGKQPERMISGKLVVDSVYGCNPDHDFSLETTEFITAGDTTIRIKASLEDNETFGDWGFRLAVRDARNVRVVDRNVLVRVKDDERILGFASEQLVVDEGGAVNIPVALFGGNASNDIQYSVEVIDGTTADDDQYTLPDRFNPIYPNASGSSFALKTFRTAVREDRIVKLRISTTDGASSPGKILYDKTQECSVVIRNTDASVGFTQKTVGFWFGESVRVPLTVAGIENDILVYVKVKESSLEGTDVSVNGNSGNLEVAIPVKAGEKVVYCDVLVNKLTSVKPIDIEVSNVVGEGASVDDINPNFRTIRLDLLERLQQLAGAYTFTTFRQDQNMKIYPQDGGSGKPWMVEFKADGSGGIVAMMNQYLYSNGSWESGDSKLTFDLNLESNTFDMRLGEKAGDLSHYSTPDANTSVMWKSRNTGNSGNYGTTVPVQLEVDVTKNELRWNTEGILSDKKDSQGRRIMYPRDWTGANAGLRIGIGVYTDPDNVNFNTNIRCFKLTKN